MIDDFVIDECFIERVEISSILQKRIDAFQRGYRQNVGFIGRQFSGKTSLLRHSISNLSSPNLIIVYIEVVPEPFDYFAKKFMGTILQSYVRASGIIMPEGFDGLVKRTRKYLPQTIKSMRLIKQHIINGNHSKAFELLLTLTQTLFQESGKKVLFIIDEFDRLQQFGLHDPFVSFSQEIMVQKDTMYVVSSSRPKKAEQIFREQLSLLFGNFESISVLPFNFSESFKFIKKCLGEIKIEDSIINFLVRLTDGQPYYLNIITKEIKRHAYNNCVTDEVLIDVLTSLVFRPSGQLHQHLLLELSSLNKGCQFYFYLNILTAIACGRKKLNVISRFIEKNKDETKKGLQRLIEEGFVNKAGCFYCIRDVFLRFWLRYVFYKKFITLGLESGRNETKFRSEIYDLIDSTCHDEHKELSKRVEELLRSFHNDVIEVNSSRIKCPAFSEVYLRPTNGRIFPVYAKSPNTRWLCQVASKPVEEEDVQILVNDSQKIRKKVNKRILITPYGIDLNAKLMAKQEKISIWNLRNLNFIFDLYDKPKVIV